MDSFVIKLIGYAAALCTTTSFLPQLSRIIRTRSTEDISLGMFLIYCAGVALWLGYGLALNAMPIILANAVTLVLAGTILGLKLRYERQKRESRRRMEIAG